MKIIEDSKEKIVVKASVPKRKFATDPPKSMDILDVIQFLKTKDIAVSESDCTNPTILGNYADNLPLSWEFVFIKKKALTPAPKVDKVTVEVNKTAEQKTSAPTTTKSTTSSRRRRRARVPTPKKENQLLRTKTVE